MEKIEKSAKYEMNMCEGPLALKMLRFSLPIIFAGVLQLLFNAADIVVVGKFCGDNSMAAVGSNGAMVNLLVNFFIGLSSGVNVLAARYYGAGMREDLSKVLHTSMVLSLIGGAGIAAAGIILAPAMLEWMSTPPEVIGLAAVYLRVYFIGMPAAMLYNFGSALMRAVGDTKRPLYYLSAAGVLNVVLNVIFVIVLRLDVVGVAAATVISQIMSASLIVYCMMKKVSGFRLELKEMKIDLSKLKQILKIGLPAGIQSTLFSISNVVIQKSINGFGEVVLAGNTAAANLEGFVYVSMNAFYQTVISFTGQNFGRRKYRRIVRIEIYAQLFVIAIGLLTGGLLRIFGDRLMWLYSGTAEVVQAGVVRFGYVALPYFLCGMMECITGVMRGMGVSFIPMIVSLLGACGLRLLWLATVFEIPQYHVIETVYISYPISWLITTAAHFICFLCIFRRIRRQYPENAVSEAKEEVCE